MKLLQKCRNREMHRENARITMGLMSYALAQTLEQSNGHLTYRDLARRMVPPAIEPIVVAVVQLPCSREHWIKTCWVVASRLGGPPLYLERINGQWCLSLLPAGLTPGTILALHAPDTDPGVPAPALSYIRVTDVAPLYSRIESIDYQGLQRLPDLERIPPFSTCTIVPPGTRRPAHVARARVDGPFGAGTRDGPCHSVGRGVQAI